MSDTLRKAGIQTLAEMLADQQNRKLDVVVPTRDVWSKDGNLYLRGVEQEITLDGVTSTDRQFRPTSVFDEGLSAKLGVPLAYMRRMRESGWVDMIDGNVNGLLHGYRTQGASDGTQVRDADTRSFMVRAFKGQGDELGTARAFLSDRYKRVDNHDVLMAVLAGMQAAGLDASVIDTADLTERRMYLRVTAPQIQAYAPELLKGYRSPFTGNSGDENPTVFAGFVVTNSETGNGRFTITPRLVFEVCTNGMTITKDAFGQVHLGGKLDEGVIKYSDDTQEKNLALVTAQTRDAVKTFLDVDYVKRTLAGMTEAASAPVAKPQVAIKELSKRLAFDQDTADSLMDHFIKGGQMTKGGLMQAITSVAQTVEDADKAADMEAAAVKALA